MCASWLLSILFIGFVRTQMFEEEDVYRNNSARNARAISIDGALANRMGLVCPALLFGRPSSCKSAVSCSSSYLDILRGPTIVCPGVHYSFCCPDIFTNKQLGLHRVKDAALVMVSGKPETGVDLSEDGRIARVAMPEQEKNIVASATRHSKPAVSGNRTHHELALAKATELAVRVIEATRALKNRFNLSPIDAAIGLQRFDVRDTSLKDACPVTPFCSFNSKFRKLDGSCNNRLHPNWGKTGTPLERILPPKYSDGIWASPKMRNGAEPPNPRLIRTRVLFDEDRPWSDATHMAMQWGQFLDHDLSHVPMFRSSNNSVLQCCSPNGEMLPVGKKNKLCFEIEIPSNDPFFGPKGVRCLNMVRSVVAPRDDCRFGYADQMNTINHFIDASQIYGNTAEDAHRLREFKGGRLRVMIHDGRTFTPEDPNGLNCIRDANTKGCFISGDDRMNQVPGLTALHIIFLREHNRIAEELEKANPRWGDERVYEETRRIIGAIMQRITYNEYLPAVLGQKVLEAYGFLSLSKGFSNSYIEKVNPSITNEFATAAFRMGHSLIQGDWHVVDESGNWVAHKLREWFNKPSFLKDPDQMDSVLRGLVEQRCQSADDKISSEITNHLFQRPGKDHGFDLVSINIRRGRDHGLDGYNAYRQVCGLPRARTFEDLFDVINREAVARLRTVYPDVNDIDLYVGGLLERTVPGGMVGPTFTCIIADQFARLREGDRFFYENGGQPSSFTAAQLEEIRKASLSRLMCDNSDNIRILQPLVFRLPGKFNPRHLCKGDAIPRMNFTPWKE